jgi:hypothetical protein
MGQFLDMLLIANNMGPICAQEPFQAHLADSLASLSLLHQLRGCEQPVTGKLNQTYSSHKELIISSD